MVTDGDQTFCDDHFEMYRNIKSFCCITETKTVLQVNLYFKNKETNKLMKRSDLWFPEARGWGGWDQMKAVKKYKRIYPVIR